MARGVLAGVAVIAMAVAGCGAPARFEPLPGPVSSAPEPSPSGGVSAARAFGNAPTVDPCSIVDVAAAGAKQAPPDALDSCPVTVTLPDGKQTLVSVGPLEARNQPTARFVTGLSGGMSLYQQSQPPSGSCTDYISFTDAYFLDVAATEENGTADQVCPAADTVAKGTATLIASGKVRHRTFAANSVGPIDPCGLVPVSVLTSAGVNAGTPTEFPEHHECDWFAPDTTGQNEAVSLDFILGNRPAAGDPATDTSTMIAGRPTVLSSGGSTPGCFADTALHPFAGGGADIFEIAQIVVSLPGSTASQACQVATTVATTAWPRLPT